MSVGGNACAYTRLAVMSGMRILTQDDCIQRTTNCTLQVEGRECGIEVRVVTAAATLHPGWSSYSSEDPDPFLLQKVGFKILGKKFPAIIHDVDIIHLEM